MGQEAGEELVEVLGGVRAEMAGEAVGLLRASGIAGEARRAGMPGGVATWSAWLVTWDVRVAARDAERALEILAVAGFPSRDTPAAEAEADAADASAADASVADFLKREG